MQVVALAIVGGVRLSDMDSPTQLQKGRFVAGLFALAAVSLSMYDGACATRVCVCVCVCVCVSICIVSLIGLSPGYP